MTVVTCGTKTCGRELKPGQTCHGHTRALEMRPTPGHGATDCQLCRGTWKPDCTVCQYGGDAADTRMALHGEAWALVAWAAIASSHWGLPPVTITAYLTSSDPGHRRAL